MWRFLLVTLLGTAGCANTVYRMEGRPTTPGGTARTACEKEKWLVMAPTRAEIADPDTKRTRPREGVGLYRVGSSEPESLTALHEELEPAPMIERKRSALESYDRDRIIAASLGGAGLVAIAVGTALFVSAFETVTVPGSGDEEQRINGGRAGAGGAVVGLGFGLGITGLMINPTHAERTRANATRYMFLPSRDEPEEVEAIVERHNATIRRRCRVPQRP